MSNNRCETCRHFQPDNGGLLAIGCHGLCREGGPTTQVVPIQQQTGIANAQGKQAVQTTMVGMGFWPAVRKHDYCGRWEKKRGGVAEQKPRGGAFGLSSAGPQSSEQAPPPRDSRGEDPAPETGHA